MKYEVVLHKDSYDLSIDVIEAPEDYTADDYVADCEKNADTEWREMLETGDVELVEAEG